ncbi:MAG: hypothetical protein ACRCWG_01005 [Sarcina sp.]
MPCAVDDLSRGELRKVSRGLDLDLKGEFEVVKVIGCPICDRIRLILGDVKNYEEVIENNLEIDLSKIEVSAIT